VMRSSAAQRKAESELEDRSLRASLPCARCEVERAHLYVLPVEHRRDGVRSDVCSFCFLQMTHGLPRPGSRLY
jgi:hypothetical protein